MPDTSAICQPDLSGRPFVLAVERAMQACPAEIYLACTSGFDRWFAVPGSVLMQGEIDTPFFFETEFEGARHPHYGRFLRLTPDELVEITWLTSATNGAETVVTMEIQPEGSGSLVKLTHAGFPNAELRDRHEQAWPIVLAHMDQRLSEKLRLSKRGAKC